MSSTASWAVSAVRLVGLLLLGYALAGPLRLSFYFYPKPFWDLLIDVLLIIAAVLVSMKWLKVAARPILLVVPFLAICWMRIEFILFSKQAVFEWISYGFIALWGMSFTLVWKYFKGKGGVKKVDWPLNVLMLLIGMFWGYVDDSYVFLLVVSGIFIIAFYISDRLNDLKLRRSVAVSISVCLCVMIGLLGRYIPNPTFYESQLKFEDKVIFSQKTAFSEIEVTEWNGNYWFYQDGINQFSSIDSWLYFEPFAHPAMQLVGDAPRVLVVGGENGMLLRELLRHEDAQVDVMPIDAEYFRWSRELRYFKEQHEGSLENARVNVLGDLVFRQLNQKSTMYDVIFIDVPDPVDLELNQYFSSEFYEICRAALKQNGLLVTQSGSPYFATAAFQSIQATMQYAGFQVEAYHNQVLTLGEWAWTIGLKSDTKMDLRSQLSQVNFDDVDTQWLNNEAMGMMLSFGKPYVTSSQISINSIQNPVIHKYYIKGNYQLQ